MTTIMHRSVLLGLALAALLVPALAATGPYAAAATVPSATRLPCDPDNVRPARHRRGSGLAHR